MEKKLIGRERNGGDNYGCISLTSVTIAEGVKRIGVNAFDKSGNYKQ